jgi:hypothetical protein
MKSKLTKAVAGLGVACIYNGLHLVKDLTAPLSYPLVGAVGGLGFSEEAGVSAPVGLAFGLGVGVALIPLAPLALVGNVALWPVTCVVGAVTGYNWK